MKPFQSSDEWGQLTTTCGISAVLLQLQVSKLGSILVTLRLNVTVPNLQTREDQGGHGPQPDPTTGGDPSLSIFLAPCQTTAIPRKTIRYSKYTHCLEHSLITLLLIPMPFIQRSRRSLHAPSQRSMVAYLLPSPFCGPPWLCGPHKKREPMQKALSILAAWRGLCGSFWMFSSTIYAECWAMGIFYVCGKCYALIPLNFELTWVYLPCCCDYCFISLPPNSSPWSTFQPYWLCKVHSGFVFLPLIFSRGSPCKEGV